LGGDVWLENFSYKVEVNPVWFIISFAGVTLAITIIGFIKYHTIQKINPAHALKYE
jgi:ABC-type antimicrobial peptide transport system permease subunit